MGLYQTKNLLCRNGNYKDVKKPRTEWEKTAARYRADRVLIPGIHKELQNSATVKRKTALRNEQAFFKKKKSLDGYQTWKNAQVS